MQGPQYLIVGPRLILLRIFSKLDAGLTIQEQENRANESSLQLLLLTLVRSPSTQAREQGRQHGGLDDHDSESRSGEAEEQILEARLGFAHGTAADRFLGNNLS